MILRTIIALTLFSQTMPVNASDDFKILRVTSSNPANIRIDFKVDNPTNKVRPIRMGEYFIETMDVEKIKITENNLPLSLSEGGMAQIGGCTECSINLIHLTFDYSGSVRSQHDNLINSARNFLNNIMGSSGRTLVRLSLFAGDKALYAFKGRYNDYLKPADLLDKLLTSSCSEFTLDGSNISSNLCESDTATRLNRSILNNIESLNSAKEYFSKQTRNINSASIIFTDGMGRDLDVNASTVAGEIDSLKKSGGLFYVVAVKSDEQNKKFFKKLNPSKKFELRNMSKLSNTLVKVFDEMHARLPYYFTLKICSAVRGGVSSLGLSSRKYKIPKASFDIDATDFSGGCDMKNSSQWRF